MEEQKKQVTNQLMSAKQLGLMLALSKRQIFRLNSCGKIPAPVRIGASLRWRQSDIEQWLAWGCQSQSEFEARMEERMAKHRTEGQV